MIGTVLARYRLLSHLGGGGMGVVFEAEDLELGRRVAVKLLPTELTDDSDTVERFKREARAASALSHPHICTVYDVGRHDGQPFLVMERLSGHTLRHLIGEGPLAGERILELGEQIADALDAAHQAGIVHRDLKPANLFVTDRGDAKVLDFGVARIATLQEATLVAGAPRPEPAPAGDARLTRAGTVLGTLDYMSPEQACGRPVDGRSDLFSLGVVLYEMATGRLPFRGDGMSVVAAILHDTPPPPSELAPELPAKLDDIVLRLLEKDPALRYQSAADLRAELRRLRRDTTGTTLPVVRRAPPPRGRFLAAGVAIGVLGLFAATYLALRAGDAAPATSPTPAPPTAPDVERSLVVLPFADLSPAGDQEYFADGLAEELAGLLATIPELRVASRTSAFYYQGKGVRLPDIARELGVAHALEGSVRRSADQLRIAVQLVDARADRRLWSAEYERAPGDVLAVQDEIAADVAKRLQVSLVAPPAHETTTDPEAFARLLEARYLARERTTAGLQRAVALYRQVLALAPDYAAAWEGLAWSYVQQAGIGSMPLADGYRLAREAAARALAVDPRAARAHACLGWIAMRHDRDLTAAVEHLGEAVALAPADTDILGNAALLLVTLGRLDEAIRVQQQVVSRNPLDPGAQTYLGTFCRDAGRYGEAEAAYRAAIRLSPQTPGAHAGLAIVRLLDGSTRTALEAVAAETLAPARLSALAMIEHARGQRRSSDRALDELVRDHQADWAYPIAFALAYRGEHDRAFDWLAKASDQRGTGLTWVLVDNLLAGLHADPRWLPWLRSIERAPEQLASIRFVVPPARGVGGAALAPTPRR